MISPSITNSDAQNQRFRPGTEGNPNREIHFKPAGSATPVPKKVFPALFRSTEVETKRNAVIIAAFFYVANEEPFMNKQFTLLAALAALALSASGCSKGGSGGIFDYVPNDAMAVITVNGDVLRNSDLGKKLIGMSGEVTNDETYKKAVATLGVDPIKDLKKAAVFFGPDFVEHQDHACIVADLPIKNEAVTKLATDFGVKFEEKTIEGQKAIVLEGAAFASMGGVSLMCQENVLPLAITAKSKGLAAEKDHAALKDSGDKMLMVTAKVDANASAMLGAMAPVEQLKDLKNVAVSLKANGQDLGLSVNAGFGKSENAASLQAMAAGAVSAMVPDLAKSMGLPLDANDIKITNSGANLKVDATIRKALIDQGMNMATGMLGGGGHDHPVVHEPEPANNPTPAPTPEPVPVPMPVDPVPAPVDPVPVAPEPVVPGDAPVVPGDAPVVPGVAPNAANNNAELLAKAKAAVDPFFAERTADKPAVFDNLLNYVPASAGTVVAVNLDAIRNSVFGPLYLKAIDENLNQDYVDIVQTIKNDPFKNGKNFVLFTSDNFDPDKPSMCILSEFVFSSSAMMDKFKEMDGAVGKLSDVGGVSVYKFKDAAFAETNGVKMLCTPDMIESAITASTAGLAKDKSHKAALNNVNARMLALSMKVSDAIRKELPTDGMPFDAKDVQKLTLALGLENQVFDVTTTAKFSKPEAASQTATQLKALIGETLKDPSFAAFGIKEDSVNVAAVKSTLAINGKLPETTLNQLVALLQGLLEADK